MIINRGSEPEETPEHNALQVKFLDDDFCLRFMRCFCTEFDEIARKELQEVLDRWARDAQKKLEEKKRELEQVRERLKDIAEYEAGRSTYRPYQSAENLRSETLKITAEIPDLEKSAVSLHAAKIGAIDFDFARGFEHRSIGLCTCRTG